MAGDMTGGGPIVKVQASQPAELCVYKLRLSRPAGVRQGDKEAARGDPDGRQVNHREQVGNTAMRQPPLCNEA